MKQVSLLVTTVFALVLLAPSARAQWGWPPPGYNTANFVAPDGSCYRRLCQVLRDHRQKKHPKGSSVLATPAEAVPASTGASTASPPPATER